MLNFHEVRDLFWKSLTDHELLGTQSVPIQVYISSLAGQAKPDDGTALDLLICHFAMAIHKQNLQAYFYETLRRVDMSEATPC